MKKWVIGVGVLLLSGNLAYGAWGIRVGVNAVDPATKNATVSVLVYHSTYYPYTTAWIGDPLFTPTVPAIDWGDGSTMPPITVLGGGLPLLGTYTVTNFGGLQVPSKVYGALFSHTYPSFGSFTVVTASFPGINFSPSITGVTGNYTYRGTYVGFPVFIFTNSTVVTLLANVLDIPTASTAGLGILALILAAAGFWLIKK